MIVSAESTLDASSGELSDYCAAPSSRPGEVIVRESASLDGASLGGVARLFILAPLRVLGSAGDVRLLAISSRGSVDRPTISALPHLEQLRLEPTAPLRLGWFGHLSLRGLAIVDRSVLDWQEVMKNGLPLQRKASLAHLVVDCRSSNEIPSLEGLSPKVMTLRSHERPKQTARLWRLSSLTDLKLFGAVLRDLKPMGRLSELESLVMSSPSSLDGISKLTRLSALRIYGRRCPPIAELARLSSLTSLELDVQSVPPDLAAVGDIEALEELRLELGDISANEGLEAGLLRKLLRLKRLTLHRVVVDSKILAALADLPQLKDLTISGDIRLGSREIRSVLPHVQVSVTGTGGAPPGMLAPKRIRGEWVVEGDLTMDLGVATNYDAERLVSAELERVAPAARADVELDSELGMFSAASKDRKSIDALVAVLESLKTRSPKKSP